MRQGMSSGGATGDTQGPSWAPRGSPKARTADFRDPRLADWSPPDRGEDLPIAIALHDALARRAASTLLPGLRPGWRNNPVRPHDARYLDSAGDEVVVHYTSERGGYDVEGRTVRVVAEDGAALTLEIDGRRRTFHVVADGEVRAARCGVQQVTLTVAPRFPEPDAAEVSGGCIAPMPGRVVQVAVSCGDVVEKGAPLVVLEAMMMEQTLFAHEAGTVTSVRCAPGDVVDAGAVLVEVGGEEA